MGHTTDLQGVRAVVLPGRRFGGNAYFPEFCQSLEDVGVAVHDIKSYHALLFAFDIVHVHFPEHYVTEQTFFNACKWTLLYTSFFLISKALGKKIVWHVHDVRPFRNRHLWLLNPYMSLFRRLASAVIFLNESSKESFLNDNPGMKGISSTIIPHSAYAIDLPDTNFPLAEKIRGRIAADDFLVGVLGSVKDYKNVEAIRFIGSHLENGTQIKIIVAGGVDNDCKPSMTAMRSEMGDRLMVFDEILSDEALNVLIRMVNVVLLPYRRGWNSGLAMLVLSNGGKILSSSLPMFRELSRSLGEPWIYTFAQEDEITSVLERIAGEKVGDLVFDDRLRLFLASRSSRRLALEVRRFYSRIL